MISRALISAGISSLWFI